jgi:hypothetical protein
VIGGKYLDPSKLVKFSTESGNLGVSFEKGLGCKCPQGAYNLGLDRLNLIKEKRITELDLFELWIPILRGTTFDDVCDVNLFPLKMDGLKNLSQELPCLSYKRPSLNVLFIPRAFTNDHQFGLFVSFPEHKGVPCSVEFASPTIPQLHSYLFQGGRRNSSYLILGCGDARDSHFLKVFKMRF